MKAPTSIAIKTEYITLGQFLKFSQIIDFGGLAKGFLANHEVLVNGEIESRRGRKLYPGDQIAVEGQSYIIAQ